MSRDGPEIAANSDEIIALGGFAFDPARSELRDAAGTPVDLRSQSLEVLRILAERAGEVVTKDAIIAAIWGDTFVTDDSLVQCIADIRRAIDDADHKLIQTLPRRGYRLMSGLSAPLLPPQAIPDLTGTRSIAVLPFSSLSGDPEQAYFSDGLTEDLIARLSMVRRLTVLAAPSSYGFKGGAMRVARAGVDLGPDFLLKGSVRRSGDRLRVTTQLIEAESGKVLMSRRFDSNLDDVFDIQDELADNIITETQVVLTEGESARLAQRGTRNVRAWEYFHLGLREHLKYAPDANQAARDLFARALQVDPDYYAAMVADGWALWIAGRSSFNADPDADLRACREWVDRLTERNPDIPDTWHLNAALMVLEGRFDEAIALAARIYDLGPGLIHGRSFAAFVHLYAGNLEQARDYYLEQIRTAPILTDDVLHYYAHTLTLIGEYDDAITLAQEYRRRVPGTAYAFTLLATAQGLAGNVTAAAATIAELRRAYPAFTLGVFRRHEPYRDAATLDRIAALLHEAGLPK